MGAWGAGVFENDDALDLVNEVTDGTDLQPVEAAFERVRAIGSDYLEAPDCSAALAAAEIVATLHGNPSQESAPEGLPEWIRQQDLAVLPALQNEARLAVERVLREPSELLELWSEGDPSEWLAVTNDLLARLS